MNQPRKRRSINQVKEEISVQVLRERLPEQWVIHDYGADYGIDCVIELFDFVEGDATVAETLGENIFVQLKGSSSINYGTRRAYHRGNVAKGPLAESRDRYDDIPVAKFQLEMSEILTVQAMGVAVPVLLVLVDTTTREAYFVCLNDYIDKVIIPEDPLYYEKGHKTINIPLANKISTHEDSLVPLRAYGKRSKMYGAFGTFHYQQQEIRRARGKMLVEEVRSRESIIAMVKTFTSVALRLDIWKGHEFWQPMGWSHKELSDILENVQSGFAIENFEVLLEYCDVHVWRRLANLSSMYEELVREWFMPTSLAVLCSYPSNPDETPCTNDATASNAG
ncbi:MULTISPECIES: DUF4365 domain-containing protein [Pseudomonas]|uniref:DUF4365 domain-containing protein n=1 Tax=Pseudomonas TaxID=286 RepID=UPI00066AABD9|nr:MULTISPECIES: DUF4365 domain-containing protein [Pseudomonas]EIU3490959.1 DUF4365 domain-containing protein [Pseudomonas aeruginosa]MBA4944016.1 DUF4365 domain-containing protein [Pseudomonas aeruginosa]MBG4883730.1 DUF4365 domain-containing protein [Pseudomonas aeruginosa]MBI7254315.1 DUF4365 domain-containing protein [Pseudomonas aeruginosa]MBI8560615.1 DUF4365 domain-containing protein [Pseudomonas aeruginosa]